MDDLTGPLLVISPHLDDAVLSCASVVARHPGTWVVTVFAGMPDDPHRITPWDMAAGFGSAQEAMTVRRAEDLAALRLLSARPRWLDYPDRQYGGEVSVAELERSFEDLVHDLAPASVCFPAGLFHSDHALVHEAVLGLRRQRRARGWIMYEEAMYRRVPGLLQRRLAALLRDDIVATPAALHCHAVQQLKRDAAACYRSQLRALEKVGSGYADAEAPERYWRLEPAP